MLGFDVQDQIQGQPNLKNGPTEPKVIHFYNMARQSEEPPGPPPMIPIEIVQMDLVALPGPTMPIPFSELRERGLQETLPWIPVGNEKEPISLGNPHFVPPDSFFDVFFDIELELPPDALRSLGPVLWRPGWLSASVNTAHSFDGRPTVFKVLLNSVRSRCCLAGVGGCLVGASDANMLYRVA